MQLVSSGVRAQEKGTSAARLSDDTAPAGTALAENADALPGFVRVQAPVPSPALVSLAAQGEYGLYSKVGTLAGPSVQYTGRLAAGYTPIRYFSARLSLRGDYNEHSGDPYEKTQSLYGEPEIAVRGQLPLQHGLYVGAELETRLIGAEAPDIDFSATTPTLRGLFAYNWKTTTWFAGQLGFRFDNSAHAIEEIERLRDGDRRTLHASSFNAIELGIAASHRWDRLELLGEISTDVLVGSGAPSFKYDPISLDVGVRYDLLPRLNLRGHLEYSPSSAPSQYPTDVLIATRPRVLVGLGLSFRLGVKEAAAAPAPEPVRATPSEKPKPAPAPPATGAVSGRVMDEGGRPLTDVRVILHGADGTQMETFTDAEGRYQLKSAPVGAARVTVETPGYDTVEKEVSIFADDESALEYTMYESLPAGQVRGRVLDLAGNPVAATITVSPGDATVPVGDDGSFSVDLKPGRYTVRFMRAGYTTQVRVVRVQDKGVVVVNIALEQ